MVAELFAMIAGAQDQRIVTLPGRLQLIQQFADIVIDLADHTAIDGAQLCDVRF